MRRRVVVTGLGMVTPLGLTVQDTWQALIAGKSGVGPITQFDASQYTTRFAASVKDFDPLVYLNPKEARKFDIFVQYAVAAAKQALDDSALQITESNAPRVGVAVGSGIGGLPSIEKTHQTILESGPRRISPFFIPGTIINMAPGLVSMMFGAKGPNYSIVTACTTGAHNIGYAMRTIQYGDADVMIAGGAEMAICPLGLGGFAACRALSTRNDEPEKASRPWDKDRDGFVLGDGAGVLILEEYEHAKKRGAKIYAELAGFGMSADAYHITSPDPDASGFVATMTNALHDAQLSPDKINYINAHGTSTPAGDEVEVKAVKLTFGEHAKKLSMSSTKSMTGHLLGAAGAIEAIFSVLAIRDQVAPPTINLDNPSEGCDIDLTPHTARKMKIDVALSNSFGFGGTNGSLIFRTA
ncbi:MAG: beta-ketoacyl-ACP synthase II [Gammaproteobacteria bacterium]|nr:beta-ketoacyl-ACP synthase II [Gammaproteobacteria bacterium]